MALRVYLSSTYVDLKDYRDAVFKALEKGGLQVARMEAYTAADDRPMDLCLRDVAQSDLYVGVFGWRYGFVPPIAHGNEAGLSITELEYRRALTRHIPTLLFLSDESTREQWPECYRDDWTGNGESGKRITALRAELGTEKTRQFFADSQQLATDVLAAILRSGAVKRPFLVPPMPVGFVARARETADIKRNLLSGTSHQAVAITAAIQGAGGFGKTTLASAVCHDPEIIAAFPGGVLWTELGQAPDIQARLTEWYHALCSDARDMDSAFMSAEDVRRAVSERIARRGVLLVVDDVWNALHLKPFSELGTARLLYTSRIKQLIPTAQTVPVDEMTKEQAAALLARDLPVARDDVRFRELADRLGNWALLLELANARLIEEFHARGAIEAAYQHVTQLLSRRGVFGLDVRNAESRNQAVRLTLQIGIEEGQTAVGPRAYELGIFPGHTAIPVRAIVELWGNDQFTIEEDFLRPLDQMHVITWNRQENTVRLHDVVRAGLAALAGNRSAVHQRLIDSWGVPARIPSDHSYAWRWFGWHCVEAGQPERLRDCLFDPGWLHAKLTAVGVAAIIGDCERLSMQQDEDKTASRKEDRAVELLADALRKSAHVLAPYPDQLENQLFGRFRPGLAHDLDDLLQRIAPRLARQRLGALFPRLDPVGGALRLTLVGHQSTVRGALLLPDGQALSWSADHTLRIWDLATGASRTLTGHKDAVGGALLLPDGQMLWWSADHTLRIWDLATGTSRTLTGHKDAVGGALLLPDGQALSWSADRTLRIWDLATGASRVLTGHKEAVVGALLLLDGQALTWSADMLRIWNLATGESRALTAHQGPVRGALLLPDDLVLSWSGAWSAGLWGPPVDTLHVWNLATGANRVTVADRVIAAAKALYAHTEAVGGALLLPDGRVLSWSGAWKAYTLRIWDFSTGASRTLTGHEDAVVGAMSLPDGQALSWSADRTLRVWDLATGASRALTGHKNAVAGALLLPDGQALSWSGGGWSSDRTLRVWDLATGESRMLNGHEGAVEGALLLPDGHALSWSADHTLRVWDLATGVSEAPAGHEDAVEGTLALPDGHAMSWSADRTLRIWDLATGASRTLTGHNGAVEGALLLPDGQALSWSADRTLRVWDLATGASRALTGHEDVVEGALLLPDGQALSWSADRTLRMWDLATSASRALTWHEKPVGGALLLPDGQVLSWSADTLRIWDLETGASRTLTGHKGPVRGAVLLPDGQVLSWSADRTLRVWDLATGASRALTWHEKAVKGALLLPDGQALLWSADHTLRIWDLTTGASRTLTGHKSTVEGALLLPDGQALSWSADHTLRVWRLEDGEETGRYVCEGSPRGALMVDTNLLLIGDATGHIYFLRIGQAPVHPGGPSGEHGGEARAGNEDRNHPQDNH
ncbi:DUF4062 domain-containing protein [Paraburkholderia tuberum]|uniref:WD40 repeat n=1 Tax=Paraburkholderia tuberum TaxID=157910 RepID=A0A1H1KI33_9BURK|nr:DUF4062 domain-containing protein [Paraburkholderia tuberum]SDR61727.1 WD40 repeat [Paraburkholderia tuberum]